jgi:hypothetical protein
LVNNVAYSTAYFSPGAVPPAGAHVYYLDPPFASEWRVHPPDFRLPTNEQDNFRLGMLSTIGAIPRLPAEVEIDRIIRGAPGYNSYERGPQGAMSVNSVEFSDQRKRHWEDRELPMEIAGNLNKSFDVWLKNISDDHPFKASMIISNMQEKTVAGLYRLLNTAGFRPRAPEVLPAETMARNLLNVLILKRRATIVALDLELFIRELDDWQQAITRRIEGQENLLVTGEYPPEGWSVSMDSYLRMMNTPIGHNASSTCFCYKFNTNLVPV